MGSVNIAIKDEAYRFLKSLKAQDESFSDVILKFKEKKGFTGKMLVELRNNYDDKLKDIDFNDVEKRIKEFRGEGEKRMGETARNMKGKNDRH